MYRSKFIRLLCIAPLVSSCASYSPGPAENTGVIVGSVAGAVAGHQMDDEKGALVGAAIGAIAGAMVGSYMDEQQLAIEKALQDDQNAKQIELKRLEDETLKLIVSNEVTFEFDSAEIKPTIEPSLEKLARLLVKYNQTIVHIIGHSDNIGSSEYNSQLSIRRANSIADYFVAQGVSSSRLRLEGRGETDPRAQNDTEEGRRLNRRVAIYVKPVIQGKDAMAYESPRY